MRDVAMIASGTPRRLRALPAALLWCEAAAAAAAVATGSRMLRSSSPADAIDDSEAWELLRKASVGVLFGLHTLRFGIYLSPDGGQRV